MYITDLADGLSSNPKLFAFFSVVHNANTTAKELNNNFKKNQLMGLPVENEFEYLS